MTKDGVTSCRPATQGDAASSCVTSDCRRRSNSECVSNQTFQVSTFIRNDPRGHLFRQASRAMSSIFWMLSIKLSAGTSAHSVSTVRCDMPVRLTLCVMHTEPS